jgi:polyisoprenoid-binding protein YceI
MSTTTSEPAVIPQGTWVVDPAHSSVGFAVKHMGIAMVRGEFTEFEGTLEIGGELAASRAHGTAKVASVNTNEERRDEDLRSPNFFDAATYPEIRFESTKIEPLGGDEFRITGKLTMHGVTNETVLHANVLGTHGPVRQRSRGARVDRPAVAGGLRDEVQPGARQR